MIFLIVGVMALLLAWKLKDTVWRFEFYKSFYIPILILIGFLCIMEWTSIYLLTPWYIDVMYNDGAGVYYEGISPDNGSLVNYTVMDSHDIMVYTFAINHNASWFVLPLARNAFILMGVILGILYVYYQLKNVLKFGGGEKDEIV